MKSTFLLSMLCLIGMACSKPHSPVPVQETPSIQLLLKDTLSGQSIDSVRVMQGTFRLKELGYTTQGKLQISPIPDELLWFSKLGYQLHGQTCPESDTIYLKPYVDFYLQVETGKLRWPIELYGSFNESPVRIYSDTVLKLSHAAMSWVKWKYSHDGFERSGKTFLHEKNQIFPLRMP